MVNKSVIVAMSGGVDSSVAAFILKQQGFNVTGVFMKNWEEDDDISTNYCSATKDLEDAQKVCDLLNIKLYKVNFAAEYWDKVFKIFLNEYQAGRTPNPDVLCNKEIKFKVFLDYAKKLQADFIATGHYVRILKKNNESYLLAALDQNKDQSYFLHALSQEQLKDCLFPLGELTKPQVRKIAKEIGFNNYNKKDSTGICFIGERKFKNFLKNYLPNKPGLIVTETGHIIGNHDGLMYYTIGQRKGLNIGGQTEYVGHHQPWYVIDKNLNNNQLIVATGKNHPKLFTKKLRATNCHWINNKELTQGIITTAKIRYRQEPQICSITINNNNNLNELLVTFEQTQRAISPGQFVVFYQKDYCLGGATIEQAIS
jgi:tRNA-specific 2-thiouridylase